jgi:hypothetical protein
MSLDHAALQLRTTHALAGKIPLVRRAFSVHTRRKCSNVLRRHYVHSATHPLFVVWGPAPPKVLCREMVGQGPTLHEYTPLIAIHDADRMRCSLQMHLITKQVGARWHR